MEGHRTRQGRRSPKDLYQQEHMASAAVRQSQRSWSLASQDAVSTMPCGMVLQVRDLIFLLLREEQAGNNRLAVTPALPSRRAA